MVEDIATTRRHALDGGQIARPKGLAPAVQYAAVAVPLILFVLFTASSIGHFTKSTFSEIGAEAFASQTSGAEPGQGAAPARSPASDVPLGTVFAAAGIGFLVLCAILLTILVVTLRAERARHVQGSELDSGEEPTPVSGSDVAFAKRQQILRVVRGDARTILQGRLEVQHVMTRNPHTVLAGQSVQEALDEMNAKGVDHLLVTDQDNTLIGLVSKYYADRCGAKRVADAMLTDPITVEPTALLSPTVTQMIVAGVSCIAVAKEGRPVGVLTTVDIHLALQCTLVMLLRASNGESDAAPDRATETQEPSLVG